VSIVGRPLGAAFEKCVHRLIQQTKRRCMDDLAIVIHLLFCSTDGQKRDDFGRLS
jgi:hypothetical protein